MNEKTMTEKIKVARKIKNLSQTELARLINMSPQSVSKWENGEGLPDVLMLGKIAEVLEKDIAYFYGEDSESKVEDNPNKDTSKIKEKKRAVLNKSYGRWKDMNFVDVAMKNYDYKFAKFEKCDFSSTDFCKSSFPYTEFYECKLTYSDFSECEFFSCGLL